MNINEIELNEKVKHLLTKTYYLLSDKRANEFKDKTNDLMSFIHNNIQKIDNIDSLNEFKESFLVIFNKMDLVAEFHFYLIKEQSIFLTENEDVNHFQEELFDFLFKNTHKIMFEMIEKEFRSNKRYISLGNDYDPFFMSKNAFSVDDLNQDLKDLFILLLDDNFVDIYNFYKEKNINEDDKYGVDLYLNNKVSSLMNFKNNILTSENNDINLLMFFNVSRMTNLTRNPLTHIYNFSVNDSTKIFIEDFSEKSLDIFSRYQKNDFIEANYSSILNDYISYIPENMLHSQGASELDYLFGLVHLSHLNGGNFVDYIDNDLFEQKFNGILDYKSSKYIDRKTRDLACSHQTNMDHKQFLENKLYEGQNNFYKYEKYIALNDLFCENLNLSNLKNDKISIFLYASYLFKHSSSEFPRLSTTSDIKIIEHILNHKSSLVENFELDILKKGFFYNNNLIFQDLINKFKFNERTEFSEKVSINNVIEKTNILFKGIDNILKLVKDEKQKNDLISNLNKLFSNKESYFHKMFFEKHNLSFESNMAIYNEYIKNTLKSHMKNLEDKRVSKIKLMSLKR